ncbi:ferric reductase NAD binding domain-containing protein [Fusarium solani]|uniref:Ferric reductase NAD binding domain-containing protein n=1 Tax=Fusarium solani TaxID=169388 RepID=A0A9P9KQF1_FUSSL|nr:ferric reductase NAD binding domain-containing protein [Fusarium solani]KAH7266621.1 ferric reductase NAD binding domain-containing protein [Fusarium solani]
MAGGQADPAFIAKLARRKQMNFESMAIFAGAMAGLFCLFAFPHLLRRIGAGLGASRKPNVVTRFFRKVRSACLQELPWIPSGAHLILITAYLAINVIVTFTNLDNQNMSLLSNVASRTGWMGIANLLIAIFLSLKNTPLAILTASSYERLNILHRVAGYTTLIFVIVHSCAYAAMFGQQGLIKRLTERNEIFGMVATGSLLVLSIAGAVLRSWWYELFYYIHVTFWIVAIITTGLHQPEPSKKVLYAAAVAGGIWFLERIVRFIRIVINSTNNTVTLMPLPNGGTRVTLAKAPLRSAPGKHGFLWIPAVRAAETHPFTIVATNPLEFIVAAHDGFTQTLHKYALQSPGIKLKASVEGPYGAFPDASEYDKVVLMAGGSGASFTVGAALNMLEKLREEDEKEVEFIWMIKNQTYLTWFSDHLETLRSDRRISVKVYVTRVSATEIDTEKPPSTANSSSNCTFVDSDPEKEALPRLTIPRLSADIEKDGFSSPTESPASLSDDSTIEFPSEIPVMYGRPDVASLIHGAVDGVSSDKRVLVMGCGPRSLISTVRNVTAECITSDGPGVELHCEQFGW